MRNGISKSVSQAAPPIGVNMWQWFGAHDLNWYLSSLVSIATILYIGMQVYYLRRNNGKKS